MSKVEIPTILRDVPGKTIGAKIDRLTYEFSSLYWMVDTFSPRVVHDDELLGLLDERHQKAVLQMEAVLNTGIGDWIRGSEMWNRLHKIMSDIDDIFLNVIEERGESIE